MSFTSRFVQKRMGKTVILANHQLGQIETALAALHQEIKKMERRQTMYQINRLLQTMHKGEEKKRYWLDTIRHYNQKKCSFFVTNILAARKISVPLR